MLGYSSIRELCEAAEKRGVPISEAVLEDQAVQMERTAGEIYARMRLNYQVMREAVEAGKDPDIRSTSGLTGGDAGRMEQYGKDGGISGSFLIGAITRALAVSEYNAAMGKIVAAPTAGSCAILPSVVLTMVEERGVSEHEAVMSLMTAGAFGIVIAQKASISGAAGGCQAECGSAAGMAAAAMVEMAHGTPAMCAHACAMAIKNQLGLVCDPVAGLVEIPCIKRNVGGVAVAVTAAEMALAGIESKIPVDEVIVAMKHVGDAIPCSLKETANGGLAQTPTALAMAERLFGK